MAFKSFREDIRRERHERLTRPKPAVKVESVVQTKPTIQETKPAPVIAIKSKKKDDFSNEIR